MQPFNGLLCPMSGDVVLAIGDLAGHNVAIEQIILGAIGTEADDACSPSACHPRHLEQLIETCRVNVDFLFGRYGHLRRRLIL